MGSETRQRSELASLINVTQAWQDWTGIADDIERLATIVWPELPGKDQLPAINLTLGASSRKGYPPGASHMGFRASGTIMLMCFDAVADTDIANIQTEETRFGSLFSDLIDELAESPGVARWESGMRMAQVDLPANPWARTDLLTYDDLDEDDAAIAANDHFVGPVWVGKAFVRWGPFA